MSSVPGPLVLIIEDDARVRSLLKTSLTAHGHRTIEASSAEEGLKRSEEYAPELILLDLGLPDRDGLEIVHRVRTWSTAPIIVISARAQESQKVLALDAGADDYLTKPFGSDELLARIRAALRRSQRARKPASARFEAGALTVDLELRRVELLGAEVHLTAIEYKLLETLIADAGKVLTHKQLLERVWGPQHSTRTEYLRVYMAHLRRKLEPDPLRPRLFLTEAGVGYRLKLGDPGDLGDVGDLSDRPGG